MKYYLGVDIGTSESKAALVNEEFQLVGTCAKSHDVEQPEPGYFEHDAQKVWWGDFCFLCKEIMNRNQVKAEDILAVGCSALGADLVPVDENCNPLRKAILYGIDARAGEEIAYLNHLYGKDKVLEFNGRPLCSNDIPPKMLWLKNHEPKIWKDAYKLLTASSFLAAKLTGNYVIDRFLAYGPFAPLYDPQSGQVNMEYTPLFCRPDQLAEVRETIDIAGTVTLQAAKECGLVCGTPVIAGTDDACAEAISTGVLEEGDLMLMLGSSLYMIGICRELIHDTRIWPCGFLIPGKNCVQGGTNAAGTLTKWYRDEIFSDCMIKETEDGVNAFQRMAESIHDIPAGSGGLIHLPYLAGERTPLNDPSAKGMLFGLSLQHTRSHMYKAALEAIGYTIRQHIDIFRENHMEFNKIYAVGGGAKNREWLQIIADITDCEIHVAQNTVGASFGDALMAALGIGKLRSFSDLRNIISDECCFYPRQENREIYDRYQKIYGMLYERTADLMHSL